MNLDVRLDGSAVSRMLDRYLPADRYAKYAGAEAGAMADAYCGKCGRQMKYERFRDHLFITCPLWGSWRWFFDFRGAREHESHCVALGFFSPKFDRTTGMRTGL